MKLLSFSDFTCGTDGGGHFLHVRDGTKTSYFQWARDDGESDLVFICVGGFVGTNIGSKTKHESFAVRRDVGRVIRANNRSASISGHSMNLRIGWHSGGFCGIITPTIDRKIVVRGWRGKCRNSLTGDFTGEARAGATEINRITARVLNSDSSFDGN